MDTALKKDSRAVEFLSAVGIILFVTLGIILAAMDYLAAGIVCLALPFVIILVSSPGVMLYFYLFSVFIWRVVSVSPPVTLMDVIALLLMASFFIDYFTNYRVELKFPAITRYYFALLLIMIMATVFAHSYTHSINPILRVSIQLFMIIIIYNLVSLRHIEKLVKFYFWVAVFHALYNTAVFLVSAGTVRAFGTAKVYFDDLAMLAVPIGLGYFLWQKSGQKAFLYGAGTLILITGLLATQSRGPMLTVGWVGLAVIIISARRAGKLSLPFVRKRIIRLVSVLAVLVLILFVFSDIFSQVGGRYAELSDPSRGTIWLRMSLWRTSLIAFIHDPLTGAGPGNFRFVGEMYPFLKFDPARLHLGGLSAHNLFLHYLAETGIFGALVLAGLFFKHFRTALGIWKMNLIENNLPLASALLGVGMIIFFSIFYLDGWMWGQNSYIAPMFIALTAGWAANLKSGKI